jgi:hypothetical protein
MSRAEDNDLSDLRCLARDFRNFYEEFHFPIESHAVFEAKWVERRMDDLFLLGSSNPHQPVRLDVLRRILQFAATYLEVPSYPCEHGPIFGLLCLHQLIPLFQNSLPARRKQRHVLKVALSMDCHRFLTTAFAVPWEKLQSTVFAAEPWAQKGDAFRRQFHLAQAALRNLDLHQVFEVVPVVNHSVDLHNIMLEHEIALQEAAAASQRFTQRLGLAGRMGTQATLAGQARPNPPESRVKDLVARQLADDPTKKAFAAAWAEYKESIKGML